MKTASQILESKGYDLAEQDEIVDQGYQSNESLDHQVRAEFSITEPIHLWEQYYIGDADEEELNKKAQAQGYEDHQELLKKMDRRLIALAEAFPSKESE